MMPSRIASMIRCHRLLLLLVLTGLAFTPSPAAAQRPNSDANGLVYFAGQVQMIVQGSALADLGNVHTLQRGESVAVFRLRDGYFCPVGTLEIETSHPDWFSATDESSRGVRPMDIVMFVRTVADIRQPDDYLRRFLATQHVRSIGRNGYSTVRHLDVAMAALEVRKQHPKWLSSEGRVAGLVAAASYGPDIRQRLDPLASQINQIRALDAMDIPASEAAGPEWEAVMTVLRGPRPEPATVLASEDAETAAAAAAPQDAAVASVPAIRAAVDRELFDRNQEERNTVSLILTAMLRQQVGNERLWVRSKLLESQFPKLASDDQIYFDFEALARQLRDAN